MNDPTLSTATAMKDRPTQEIETMIGTDSAPADLRERVSIRSLDFSLAKPAIRKLCLEGDPTGPPENGAESSCRRK